MIRQFGFAALLIGFSSIPCLAQSQSAAPDQKTADTKPAAPATSANDMLPLAVGDHWTYELHDNITGNLKGQFTQTVTDSNGSDVSVQVVALGAPSSAFLVYDHLWNLKTGTAAKYAPNDGTGIKESMKAGDSWNIKSSDIRASRTLWKRTETSKVLDEEAVTTQAGTFNAIKYETTIAISGALDPTKKGSSILTTWYVPSVNHWVKRVEKTVTDNHVISNSTLELVDYGRQ